MPGRRPGGGTVGVERPHATADGGADHVVEMAFLGDVERIAIVGAERQERRAVGGHQFGQGGEVLGDRALAHQDLHALGQLLARLGRRGRLVAVAHTGRDVGVEVVGRQQRRMAVDLHVGEGGELGQHRRVLSEHARHVHELGQPQHLGMMLEGQQVRRLQPRARSLEMRGRHARRELHAQVHHRDRGAVEEELQAGNAQHVADLVGIADRRGGTARQHATVELQRRHQRRFAMDVTVDEARDGDQPAAGNLHGAAIGLVRADDAVAGDRDVANRHLARGEIVETDRLDHQVGRHGAARLVDDVGDAGWAQGLSHRRAHNSRGFMSQNKCASSCALAQTPSRSSPSF